MATVTAGDEIIAEFELATGGKRVNVHFMLDETTSQAEMIRQCLDNQGQHFRIVDTYEPCAFIISQSVVPLPPHAFYGCPIICFERIDGSQLSSHGRKALQDPRVVALLKISSFVDDRFYNQPFIGGFSRFHESECFRYMAGIPYSFERSFWKAPSPQLTVDELGKITVIASWESYPQLADAYNLAKTLDPNRDRPIDVFFAGTVDYPNSPIGWHRKQCVEVLERIRSKTQLNVAVYNGRELDKPAYLDAMSKSKIVVAPYGWGEVCQREYEAAMLGCDVLKANCDLSNWGTTPWPFGYCCHPDWDDLESKIEMAIRNWGRPEFVSGRQQRAEHFIGLRESNLRTLFHQLYLRYVHKSSAAVESPKAGSTP